MTKFTYTEVNLTIEALNAAGNEGWEAFAVISRPGLPTTAWCKKAKAAVRRETKKAVR